LFEGLVIGGLLTLFLLLLAGFRRRHQDVEENEEAKETASL
jgi:hypothetical protein